MKKMVAILIVGMLLVSGMLVVVNESTGSENRVEPLYISHAPIRINNNSGLASAASSGSGIQSDPYIIENYDIDAHGGGNAIYIGNTTAYFVVENCYLHNASYHSDPYFDGAGITLYNVTNGKISGNTIMNNEYYGIYLVLCYSNNTISRNYIRNNGDGIYVESSSSNTISGNNITTNSGDGIWLYSSSSNTISGNNITTNSEDGIWLDYFSSNNMISSNNITNNSGDGIHLLDSSSNTISGNNITNSGYDGVDLDSSSSNTINSNNITNSNGNNITTNYNGIRLYSSSSNRISGNNIKNNNGYGIYLYFSSNSNTIYNNLISNNTDYGIYIYSDSHYTLIYNNSFYYNNGSGDTYNSSHMQAYDDGSNNSWNTSGTPHGYGNYWHDWANNNDTNDMNEDGIVDWPYKIDGSAGAQDNYPLMEPVQIQTGKYTARGPIRINSNADFDAAHGVTGGGGTQSDPYIIENYDIDAHGGGNAIYIGNTTAYFVIRNCTLYNASYQSSPYHRGAGVTLYNVQNGTIVNNTASNNSDGIYLSSSTNNTISNNTANSNNSDGIYLSSSTNNTISNNTANSNNNYGIYLSSSSNNNISNNTASDNHCGIYLYYSSNNTISNTTASNNNNTGIYLGSSSSNTITGNTMVDDGIIIGGDLLEYWNTHTIDTTNTVNGKPVYYWKNRTGGTVSLGAGEVILANCTNVVVENQNVSDGSVGIELSFSNENTISNNTASNNTWGILLRFSSNNTISNNTANSNNYYGIYLCPSNNNTISNNTANSNKYNGIYLSSSTNNTISNNTANSNNNYGIYLSSSSNNNIYHNNFIDNTNQAYDNTGTNFWNASYPTGGNYWSDYNGTDNYSGPNQNQTGSDGIGDTPYTNIGGGAGAQDNYPLMEPVQIQTGKYTARGPIRINSNADFDADHGVTGGIGTEADPYIIENYDIDAHGEGNAIYIGNTTAYFVVENCYLHNASYHSDPYFAGAGITLYNVSDGKISGNRMIGNSIFLEGNEDIFISQTIYTNNTVNGKPVYYYKNANMNNASVPADVGEVICGNVSWLKIEGLHLSNGTLGIELGYSSHITISKNNITNNEEDGIHLESSSSNNTISGNNITNSGYDGIGLGGSSNTISGNTITSNHDGIHLESSSSNNMISGNTITNNHDGIHLESSSSNNMISGNNITNSGYDGIGLGGSSNTISRNNIMNCNGYGIGLGGSSNTISDNTITNNHDGGIELDGSSNTISGNKITNNDYDGIYQDGSSNTISDNTITNNNARGIYLAPSSSNNIISGNNITNNWDSISLYYSSSNTISGNNITNNHDGIHLDHSKSNTIYHNNIINNTYQAYDNTGTNFWNASYPTGGNYWSDYNGTDEYSGPNQDQPGSDGIGDTPYTNIDGGSGAQDNYPLMGDYVRFKAGWNLVSIPWQRNAVNITNALSGLSWDRAMVYINNTWYTYNKNRDAKYNLGFPMVDNTIGIWVNCTSSGMLSHSAQDLGSTRISLHRGWNLVAYPSENATRTVEEALSGISYDYVQVYNTTSGQIETLTPTDIMEPGKGYWIHVKEDCVWTVEW